MPNHNKVTDGAPNKGGREERIIDISDHASELGRTSIKSPKVAGSDLENAANNDSIRKWARKSANLKKPTSLYSSLFSGKSLPNELLQRQSISNKPKEYPQPVIGLLLKKIKGAQTRIIRRKNAVSELRVILRTKMMLKNGKTVGISHAEKKSIQQRKLDAEAQLMKAKADMQAFRMQLSEAVASNSEPLKREMKLVRESSYIKRVSPSISQKIVAFVEAHRPVRQQINLLAQQSGEHVANRFLGALRGMDSKTVNLLTEKPKLATQVRQQVLEQYK